MLGINPDGCLSDNWVSTFNPMEDKNALDTKLPALSGNHDTGRLRPVILEFIDELRDKGELLWCRSASTRTPPV